MQKNSTLNWYNGSHVEFRAIQQLYQIKSIFIGFLMVKNMGIDTKIISLSILEAEIFEKLWYWYFRWRPFWKWRQIGRGSQFGDGGIHFSCSGGSNEEIKSGPSRSWGGCTVGVSSPWTINLKLLLMKMKCWLGGIMTKPRCFWN